MIGWIGAILIASKMNVLSMGDDVAKGLGLHTGLLKVGVALVIILLSGGSVAIAGPIGFIGIVIPHVARSIVGIDHRWVIPFSGLLGGILLLAADILARYVIMPQEVPVGVMTAIIGTPFFIYIARRGFQLKMSPYKSVRWFKGKISFLLDKQAAKVFILMAIATALVFIVSTGIGDMNISPLSVIQVFFGGGTEMEQLVITSFRLPRIIIGLMVGISLAIAGGILQGMIRNPLASPDMLGITGGAAVAVVGFLAFFSDENNALTVSIKWMPLAAFIGAGVIAILVYFLAWKNGVSPIRLVLIGIGLSALMQALTTLMMILGPIYRASQANIWLTGTVNGSTWDNVRILVPCAVNFSYSCHDFGAKHECS